MSDLLKRNTGIMIAEAKRMQEQVSELRGMIEAQNSKITTLSNEIAVLKQAQIMASINAQIALTGNGGTV